MLTFLLVIFMFEIYSSMLQFFLKWLYMSSLRRYILLLVIFLGSITTIQISSILVHSTCGPSYHRCQYCSYISYNVHADDEGPSVHGLWFGWITTWSRVFIPYNWFDLVNLLPQPGVFTPSWFVDRLNLQGADDKLGQIIWKHSNQ